MPTGQKPSPSEAQLYAERETRTKSSMRAEFGRLTIIVGSSITRIPSFTSKDTNQVWLVHEPKNPQALVYYYKDTS